MLHSSPQTIHTRLVSPRTPLTEAPFGRLRQSYYDDGIDQQEGIMQP